VWARLVALVGRAAGIGILPADSDEERLRKAVLTLWSAMAAIAGLVWTALYVALDLRGVAVIPLVYSGTSILSLLHFGATKQYGFFRLSQLALILCLPFAVQWELGLVNSGAVMIWSFMAVLGSLLIDGPRRAMSWFLSFLALTVVLGIADHVLRPPTPVRLELAATFFILNIAGISTIIYLLMQFFVRERDQAQERSERLLLNILPGPVAARLKRDPAAIADAHAEVTVLFADIVDFTRFSAGVAPENLLAVLNDIFSEFDGLADRHGLEKIKTIGDAYMAVAGLPTPRPDHAEAAAEMALDLQAALDGCAARVGTRLSVRIGLSTGPVVAGVIGKRRFIYDLWGDTVNTASRMESHGVPGAIQVTETTYRRLKDRYRLERRGLVTIKGKGPMETYLLVGRREPEPRPATGRLPSTVPSPGPL
jgi:adenylate cyclase